MSNSTSNAFAIDVQHVSKAFKNKAVLDDVSFRVAPGEHFCLLGPNGSGKSTLFAILSGVRRADTGMVSILGAAPNDPQLKQHRGVQLDNSSFPYYAKVKEIVWLFSGLYPRSLDGTTLLKKFQLSGDVYIRHLSKGQRQRLAILLALLCDPKLLFLDEPSSGLDPQARITMWQVVLEHLKKQPNQTLLFTTHDLDEAERFADRVAFLQQGRIVAEGNVATLLDEWVGTKMKLSIRPNSAPDTIWPIPEFPPGWIKSIVRMGTEVIFYSDNARDLVALLPYDEQSHIRVEPVSLQDVFFKLTAEVVNYDTYAAQPF